MNRAVIDTEAALERPAHVCSSDLNDNPETLVQGEARAVRVLRVALISLLVAAAMITGIFVNKLSSKYKIEAFTRDFEDVANQFLRTFKTGIANQLYYSYTLSFAMGTGLYTDAKPNFPYVTIDALDNQAYTLNLQTRGQGIIWSPLLATLSERRNWEAYAQTVQGRKKVNTAQYPPCDVCGTGFAIAYPDNLVSFPGVQGSFQCYVIAQDAASGLISADNCLAIQPMVNESCGCMKSETSTLQSGGHEWPISDGIFRLENGTAVRDDGPRPLSPVFQISPSAVGRSVLMFNQMSVPIRRDAINAMVANKVPVLSKTIDPAIDSFYQRLKAQASPLGILAVIFFPVFELSTSKVVGSLAVDFSWKLLFELDLEVRSEGAVIVLENTCDQVYTFKAVGDGVDFLGEGDLHDTAFDSLVAQSSFDDILQLIGSVAPNNQGQSSDWGCAYRIRVYPSSDMRERYMTSEPWIAALVVVSIFVFTSALFLFYDFILRRLQAKVLNFAKVSDGIVSSLFPAVVRDRIYRDGQRHQEANQQGQQQLPGSTVRPHQNLGTHGLLNRKALLKSYLYHPPSVDVTRESEPIADLFPSTTIMFADIAGFTAWSSEREPALVFKLLETLYGAFDRIANKLGVFKVETIGDCYVAVTGLPEPRPDHAVVMVEFATECLVEMQQLTKILESTLGPGTDHLKIRVGLHSGPVTAGVLRAERARFQLFGDTVNTASRMESNGKVDQIHVSKETAQLLIEAGRSSWVEPRDELIAVKGKGQMQTYWAKPNGHDVSPPALEASASTGTQEINGWGATNLEAELPKRQRPWWTASQRTFASNDSSLPRTNAIITTEPKSRESLIEWNHALLLQLLQKVVANRAALSKLPGKFSRRKSASHNIDLEQSISLHVVNHVTEVIQMPDFNDKVAKRKPDPSLLDLGPTVQSQLRDYVSTIAAMYPDHAFHNFEHASHVAMSASKLLKRIIAPDDVKCRTPEASGKTLKNKSRKLLLCEDIHKATFGISSDPLMQFAVVLAALIHDVDHPGLQNRQLVQRNDPLAVTYRGKCIAEQHSVRCAWYTLLDDRFKDLRLCIYETEEELSRFRQLVINAVIATDIADKDLQAWRKNRWEKAFHQDSRTAAAGAAAGVVDPRTGSTTSDIIEDSVVADRRATIVYEYIIQASDVAHTMQHWHIYKKWNQRLFEEQYSAYLNRQVGDDDVDPSIHWYQGELSFFDHYVIPLAKNLKECSVFGVSCDEVLTYALANRHEWEQKGQQIVDSMVELLRPTKTNPGNAHRIQ